MSRIQGPIGLDPLSASPRTPGPLGHNDAADPNMPKTILWDTPGPLGICDHADPTYLAGPLVTKSKTINPNDPRNYFGPSGADVTTDGHITTIIRRIPLVPQRSDMSCWVAAGTMVLGHAPSVTSEMWIPKNYQKGDKVGGLDLTGDILQKFMKLNGLILYHRSKWTLEGIESRLRTRSALFYPIGSGHAVVIAGIKVNKRDADSSKLIIYDPEPVSQGRKTELSWGEHRAEWTNLINSLSRLDPKVAALLRKGEFTNGYGFFLLHR